MKLEKSRLTRRGRKYFWDSPSEIVKGNALLDKNKMPEDVKELADQEIVLD